MTIGDKIRVLRKRKGLTQEELGKIIGVKKSAVAKYENNRVENLKRSTIQKLAEVFNVAPSYFVFEDDQDKQDQIFDFRRIPVYGSLCCGNGGFAEDNIEEYVNIPAKMLRSGKDYFANYASGDSMIGENINPGDLIIFEKTDYVDNGDIGCFCIDENEAMCKKFKKDDRTNIIMLLPANDKYDPVVITLEHDNFRCIGKLALVINDRQDD